jgi:hypothetical protein
LGKGQDRFNQRVERGRWARRGGEGEEAQRGAAVPPEMGD